MPAFSIRATEHSIMTARGEAGETNVVRQVLDATPNDQMVAMVGDSYNMIRFIEEILATPDIKARIEARTAPVIIRPDSGELPQIDVDVFLALEGVFGSTDNAKGFAVLPDYIRMIQGDGIKWYQRDVVAGKSGLNVTITEWRHTTEDILEAFYQRSISADNIAFGSGGGLLQQFDRDSQRFAIKCSYAERDGEGFEIFKRPQTDLTKSSKRGRLGVIRDDTGTIVTVSEAEAGGDNMLREVFYVGERRNLITLEEVRANATLPQTESV
jgi:nicotinamide phosphoribosyltransferase